MGSHRSNGSIEVAGFVKFSPDFPIDGALSNFFFGGIFVLIQRNTKSISCKRFKTELNQKGKASFAQMLS